MHMVPPVRWKDEGIAVRGSKGNSSVNVQEPFDASGVFTPGAVRECNGAGRSSQCTWFLFFGGVANQTSAHSEQVRESAND